MARLIVGCGYLGQRVARLWHAGGEQIYVVTRSHQRAGRFQTMGWTPLIGDVTRPATLGDRLPDVDAVLFAVGRDRRSNQTFEQVYEGGVKCVSDRLPDTVRRFIYISTTGVYGQAEGVVNEQTVCAPTRDGARASLNAERWLQKSRWASALIALRLAGIYGPDRLPLGDRISKGEPLPTDPDHLLNLIHVNDAAAVAAEAGCSWAPPVICNVSDGHPVARRDFYREVARRLNGPEPRFTPDGGQRAGSQRRITSLHWNRLLAQIIRHRSYVDGLAHC